MKKMIIAANRQYGKPVDASEEYYEEDEYRDPQYDAPSRTQYRVLVYEPNDDEWIDTVSDYDWDAFDDADEAIKFAKFIVERDNCDARVDELNFYMQYGEEEQEVDTIWNSENV